MPGNISIIATYRGAVFVVHAAKVNAATPTIIGQMTWKYRSPVLSACQALTKVQMTAKTYGGAVRSKVCVFPYPSVLTTVGKKLVTEAEETVPRSITMRTQTFISIRASLKPWKKDCSPDPFQSSVPMSS